MLFPSLVTAGALSRLNAQERAVAAEIERITRELGKSDASIARAQEILVKARKNGNEVAENFSLETIRKAEQAKITNLENMRLAKLKMDLIKKKKQRLSGAPDKGVAKPNLRALVSRAAGNVTLQSASGSGAKPFSGEDGGQLEPGDELRTGRGGSAELQLLGGRASVSMAENSRFRIEKDTDSTEVVRTLAGKFHFVVERMAEFEAALEQDLAPLREKLAKVADDQKKAYENFMKGLKARVQKKLEMRSRSGGTTSVRGTEFLVTEHPDGSSEILVIEGNVAVSDPNGGATVVVNTGQAITISSAGTPSTVRPANTATLPRWWEEQP